LEITQNRDGRANREINRGKATREGNRASVSEETLTFIADEYSATWSEEKTGRNIIILHHSHSQGVEKNAFASAAD